MIRFVFFDVGGVLKSGLQETKNDFAQRIGISIDQYKDFQHRHFLEIELGKMNKKQYFEALEKEFNVPQTLVTRAWDEMFIKNFHWFHDTREWALSLKKKYTVGIISNVSISSDLNEKMGVYKDFRPNVFLSCDIGLKKPDKEIFEYVNTHTHSKPGECILIDDKEENVHGAQKLGWKAIWHENLEKTKKEFEKMTKEK